MGDGVSSASVSLKDKSAEVKFTPPATAKRLVAEVGSAGFAAELLSVVESPSEDSGNEVAKLRVEGMECQMCVDAVEKAILELEGVSSASVDLSAGSAKVSFTPPVTAADILAKVDAAGFE